jgi:hypothetical protein
MVARSGLRLSHGDDIEQVANIALEEDHRAQQVETLVRPPADYRTAVLAIVQAHQAADDFAAKVVEDLCRPGGAVLAQALAIRLDSVLEGDPSRRSPRHIARRRPR